MKITNENITELFDVMKEPFSNVGVIEYNGWTNQIDPTFLVKGTPDELSFSKKYTRNVGFNQFNHVELDGIGDEKFIRLVSREYDEYDHTMTKNHVLDVGNEISINARDKQVIIISPDSPLKKLLGKTDGDEFVVFLFKSKERLERLEKFVNSH